MVCSASANAWEGAGTRQLMQIVEVHHLEVRLSALPLHHCVSASCGSVRAGTPVSPARDGPAAGTQSTRFRPGPDRAGIHAVECAERGSGTATAAVAANKESFLMRTTLFIGIGIALSAAVMAGPQGPVDTGSGGTRGSDQERCLVSFDSAQQDVCTGNVTLANPDLKRSFEMGVEAQTNFPDLLDISDWMTFQCIGHPQADAMGKRVLAAERAALETEFDLLLSPRSTTNILNRAWYYELAGKQAEMQQLLTESAKAGVPLP